MIDWIISNWSYVLSGIFALIVVASIVVKLTPSKKDDSFLAKLIDVLDRLSLAKTAKDKELIRIAKEELEGKGK